MGPIGLIDGRIVADLSEKLVEMEDRGYQFGDGVYEVTPVFNGRCFGLQRHMERLFRSLREMRITVGYSAEDLYGYHERLIQESGIVDAGIYLQITRGFAPRNHNFPDNAAPRLTMTVRPIPPSLLQYIETGAEAIVVPDLRWLRCDIKSLNLLGNVFAKEQAKEAGVFEAIQVRDGAVTEGSSTNFFAVKDGVLRTHPLSNLILQGVTRTIVVDELAPKLGLKVVEEPFGVDFATNADEAFVTGSLCNVTPITGLDGRPVGDGRIGPVTRQLVEAFTALVGQACPKG
ncbi:MAG TPA: D-amino-acid transaminase [Selenomonadales bacterium]|nr:D-amino-acid transaminase [Selenomonadales bacterium]